MSAYYSEFERKEIKSYLSRWNPKRRKGKIFYYLTNSFLEEEKEIQNKAKNDFMSFVKAVWPEFIEGAHHRVIAKKFNDLANKKINRLLVVVTD